MNRFKKLGFGASLFALAGAASAAAPDVTAITTAITDGSAAAVTVAIAFGVAVWLVRGVKMVRRA